MIEKHRAKLLLKNIGKIAVRRDFRWAHVKRLLEVTTKSAKTLCKQHGYDPYELVGIG
ncbi:MAG: hypothetical protein GY874_14230 [Desulfobacteraceae bacterium]|nr:hypothetical protein [Desulfobacteraceae bacterium]